MRHIEEDTGYDTPCWTWTRCRNSDGYGQTLAGMAHRIYYEQHRGPIPEGMELDHLCRNRACVNPDHLEPVTHAENCRRGVKAKLTQDVVRRIRERYALGGISQEALAGEFGVNQTTVSAVVRFKLWKEST